jgi:hypothetical protein
MEEIERKKLENAKSVKFALMSPVEWPEVTRFDEALEAVTE